MPRITVQVPQWLLDELDANAKRMHLSRAGLICSLLFTAPIHSPNYIRAQNRYGPPLTAPPIFGDCREDQ